MLQILYFYKIIDLYKVFFYLQLLNKSPKTKKPTTLVTDYILHHEDVNNLLHEFGVEKKLAKEEGKTRWDIGREDFVKEIWKWKEESGDIIMKQLRRG